MFYGELAIMNNFRLTKLEIALIIITVISTWLAGSKNSWTWFFAFMANFIWLYIGFSKKMAVIIITSILFLICNLRGLWMWVIVGI